MAEKATIYQRSDTGKWVIQLYWEGVKYTRSHYNEDFKTIPWKEMAQRVADIVNADIDDRKEDFDPREHFHSRDDLRFSHAVKEWLKGHEYAPSTKRVMGRSLELACGYFGNQNIKRVRKGHLRKFLATLKQGASTKRRILHNIKACLNDICDDWHIMRIPFPSVTVPHREAKWLSREWQDKIIGAIPEKHRPIFRLMQAYGCRPAEACALQWEDMEWPDRIIFRRTLSDGKLRDSTKTGFARKLPLTDEVRALFTVRGIAGYVFRRPSGDRYTPTRIGEIWTSACKSADYKGKIKPYEGLRHSKVSQLHEAGFDEESIRQFMGHRNLQTTQIYTHIDVGKFRGMV